MLLTILLYFIFTLLLIGIVVAVVDYSVSGRGYRGTAGRHFDGRHFSNIGWTKRESYRVESPNGQYGKLRAFIGWMLQRKKPKWKKRKCEKVIPANINADTTFQITFVGHATLLIQIAGQNILTDPVWGRRVSPFKHAGPQRFMDPGVDFDTLPRIDSVLLSHNHYDHMDISTLEKLHDRDNPVIYTGLGNADYLSKYGIRSVIDMDWWDTNTLHSDNESHVTFVPAQHFSARGIYDRNRTLWGGFVLNIHGKTLYFAGDTGYGAFVDEIRERYPDGFDVGLLPIGAYKPRWFMADIHTNPEEALQLQYELNIKTGLAIHWGTFPLADDAQDEPIIDLAIAQEKEIYNNLDFRVGPNGTIWTIK
ncbi:MBL fold metallo-hydrolase [Candidatus Gracilibacteria bacterium]|nr:MBL fold metallo-hydrolase [Candidatus Gracilibacteria bacterium]